MDGYSNLGVSVIWNGAALRVPRRERPKAWLHILLAAGVLLYLYSPFLDHLLDRDVYLRPHTHVHVAESIIPRLAMPGSSEDSASASDHNEHDNSVLCILNIDAILSLLLTFSGPDYLLAGPQSLLSGSLVPVCLDVSLVYLLTLNPPPNS